MKKHSLIIFAYCMMLVNPVVYALDRFDQYPVKSYSRIDHKEFNKVIQSAAQQGAKWVNNPLSITLNYLDHPNNRFVSILREDDRLEDPSRSTITIVVEGYLDDDIRGSWYELRFAMSDARLCWMITEIRKAELSGRAGAPKEFKRGNILPDDNDTKKNTGKVTFTGECVEVINIIENRQRFIFTFKVLEVLKGVCDKEFIEIETAGPEVGLLNELECMEQASRDHESSTETYYSCNKKKLIINVKIDPETGKASILSYKVSKF